MLMLTTDPPPMRRNDVATKSELKIFKKNINFYSQKMSSTIKPKKESRYI